MRKEKYLELENLIYFEDDSKIRIILSTTNVSSEKLKMLQDEFNKFCELLGNLNETSGEVPLS